MKTQQVLQQVTTRGFSVWGCKERHVCVWVRLFGGEVFRNLEYEQKEKI